MRKLLLMILFIAVSNSCQKELPFNEPCGRGLIQLVFNGKQYKDNVKGLVTLVRPYYTIDEQEGDVEVTCPCEDGLNLELLFDINHLKTGVTIHPTVLLYFRVNPDIVLNIYDENNGELELHNFRKQEFRYAEITSSDAEILMWGNNTGIFSAYFSFKGYYYDTYDNRHEFECNDGYFDLKDLASI